MSNLPRGWAIRRLSEIAEVSLGQSPPGSSYNSAGEGVPFFQGKADFTESTAVVRKWTTAGTKFAKAGDILISVRAPVGPTNFAPVDCSIGRGLAALRATSTVDQRYLFWALRASEQLLASHGTGSTFEAITGKQLKEHPVPVPPLEVQRRIVDILEDHLSRLDAAARQIESANRRVLSWQRAHADELFWSREHPTFELGDLLASPLRNGHSARASASGEGIRTLTLTAVTRGQFTDDFTKLTTADPKRVADLWLRSGDILVQRSNTPELVGTTELYSGPDDWAIFPDLLIRCRVDPARVLPAFAAGAMRTERAHRWLRVRAKGLAGSMPKIDQGTIAALRIPVPVRSEQVAIVARLAELDAATARLAASCTLAAARGVALRRALLQAALTGRLTRSTLDVQQLETVRV